MRTRNEPVCYEELHVLTTAEEKSLKHSEINKEIVHVAMASTGPKQNTGQGCPIP